MRPAATPVVTAERKPGKAPEGPTARRRSAGYRGTAEILASDPAVGTGGGGGTIGEAAAADLAIITTFQPGSGGGGGAGAARSATQRGHAGGGGGGGGGGALRIVSANKLTINGEVKPTAARADRPAATHAAGGGGGSGGAIALVGKSLSLIGKLSANRRVAAPPLGA